MEHFKTDWGKLIQSTIQLWNILLKALKDSQAGPVIIVLDALDECDSEIFMVAKKNLYYKIEFKEKQLPHDAQWKYNENFQVILNDSLDKKYRERGGWVNGPPVRGARPLISMPTLGESFDDAIFLNYGLSAQDWN
ncbi:hypothetical protein N7488_004703 [Penicillium malachiteum]|nr:hypothetical protein N7488_004703 [Penicillium malachiteum]